MILKSSLLLCSCLLFSFCVATPTPRLRRDVGEGSLLPKNVEESEIGKSIQRLVENSRWIFNNLASIAQNAVIDGFVNAHDYQMEFTLRLEFLSMVDGSHFVFPVNNKSEIEQDDKTVAIAVSKLLMNLRTMERTDEIVKNVSRDMSAKIKCAVYPLFQDARYKDSSAEIMGKFAKLVIKRGCDKHSLELATTLDEKRFMNFPHMYFEMLNHQMEADKDLRTEYKQRKTEAKETVKRDPELREFLSKYNPQPAFEEIVKFFEDKKTVLQAFPNKLFLKRASKHITMIFSAQHHRRYLLSRALIQKARSVSSSDNKINEMYHRALVEAAVRPVSKSVLSDILVMEDVLFDSIESALASDPALNAEISTIMKEIENNTVYDADMFNVDLSLL